MCAPYGRTRAPELELLAVCAPNGRMRAPPLSQLPLNCYTTKPTARFSSAEMVLA